MGSALLVMLALATGADGSATELKTEVIHWVRQLDAPELSRRNEAESKLLNLGPAILDLLPKYSDDSPASEAQRREAVGRIRDQLQRRAATESIAASVVTLKAAGRPLSETLAALTRQTGNKLKDVRPQMGQEANDPQLTVDFSKTPFWQALDQTLDQAQLTVYPFAGKDELGFMARPPGALPRVERASYAGPLRLEATQLTAERSLTVSGAGLLKLDVQVAWEPRLRPITLQLPMSGVKAVDDRGNAIALESPEGQLEPALDPAGAAVSFQILLVDPPRTAKAIGSIKGTLRVLLPGRIETFEFTGLKDAKKVEQHRAGVTVAIDEVRREGDTWEVRMRIRFDNAANALESFRSWIYNNEAYLNGPKGKIPNGGSDTTLQSKNEVGLAYKFDLPDGPDGLTFVYKTPAMLASSPLRFEFKNLPLP